MDKSYRGLGLVVVAGLIGWAVSAEAQQSPVGPGYGNARGELVTYFLPAEGKPTSLTLVDPATKRILVYHIDRLTGEISLKSARDFTGDLGLDYLNNVGLLPNDVIKGQERRK